MKQQLGKNEQAIETFSAEGMHFVAAGTLDKKDIALLTKREEEENAWAEKELAKNNQIQVVRVKAKTVK